MIYLFTQNVESQRGREASSPSADSCPKMITATEAGPGTQNSSEFYVWVGAAQVLRPASPAFQRH